MKLGIFDSGLGGLILAKSIHAALPDIDSVYFGDTLHLPYGNRSTEAIYEYTKRGIEFLFQQDCGLIVIACNTSSAAALRLIQQGFLPKAYPGRNVLGVIVPTLEQAIEEGHKNLGLIATNYIIQSGVYDDELKKIDPSIILHAQTTPLLVPLIENGGQKWAQSVLEDYLQPFITKNLDCLILGCTHYPYLKSTIQGVIGQGVRVLSQDDFIPQKLRAYLDRHREYSDSLSRYGQHEFYVSDLTDNYVRTAHEIYGHDIAIQKTNGDIATLKVRP